MTRTTMILKACVCLFLASIVALTFGWGVSAQQPTVALAADPQVDDNKTYAGAVTAYAISDRTVGVQVAFTGDRNGNGYCRYEIAPSKDGPFTANTVFREYLSGQPIWRSNFIWGLSPQSKAYIRVTFVDSDDVIGPSVQVVEVTTKASSSNATTVDQVTVTSQQSELLVAVVMSEDQNMNSDGTVQVSESATGPWVNKCDSMAGLPKLCRVRSLVPGKSHYVRVTMKDPDGVQNNATQVIGPIRYDGLENLAYNKPVTADAGWGCCPNPQVITNGLIQNATWVSGYAFRGGKNYHGGAGPGYKQATVDFGKATQFDTADIFVHDANNLPLAWRILVSDDLKTWKTVFSTTAPMGRTATIQMPGTHYYPGAFHEAHFAATTARYMRYEFDDNTCFDGFHGWIMQLEAYNTGDRYQVYSNPTDALLFSGNLATGERVEYFGSRNAQGVPTNVTSMIVVDAAGQRSQFMLDAKGRPNQIVAFNQSVFKVDWTGTTPVITATAPDGASTTYPATVKTLAAPSQMAQAEHLAAANVSAVEAVTDTVVKVTLQQCNLSVKDAAVLMIARSTSGDFQLPGLSNGDGSYTIPMLLPNRPSNATAAELCDATKKAATAFQPALSAAITQLGNQLLTGFGTTTANQVLRVGAVSIVKSLQAAGRTVSDPSLLCSLSSQPINRFANAVSTYDLELYVNGALQHVFPKVPAIGPFPNQTVNVKTQTACACQYLLSDSVRNFSAALANDSVEVKAPNGCRWEATTDAPKMIAISSGSGNGNGIVTYTVNRNTDAKPREGKIIVAGQILTVKQEGGCTFAISPAASSFNSQGGPGNFKMSATNGCPWTVLTSTLPDWIEVNSPTGSGDGTINYTVKVNTTGAQRIGKISVENQSFTVVQSASCVNSVAPLDRRFGAEGGAGFVSVYADANCPWTVANAPDWVTFDKLGGQSNGQVNYTVKANTDPNTRIATLTVGTLTVTITQEGKAACTVQLTPSTPTIPSGGGAGTISVTSPTGCTWSATSNASWLTITAGSSGSGNGTIRFEAAPNLTLNQRVATLTVNGKTATLTQAAATCSYILSPSISSISNGGTRGSFNVSASVSACSWTAVSDSSWLSIVTGKSGTGSGSVTWEATSNTTTSTRTGRITVGGQSFTLSQAGVACTASLSPSSSNPTSGAGRGSVNVTSNCPWTAYSNSSWLSIVSGNSGTGNGSVVFEYGANTDTFARYGSLTIAGKTFSVTQAGVTCSYTMSPSSAYVGNGGGRSSFSVSANSSRCAWSAYTFDSSWLRVISGSGFGSGSVTFEYSPNSGPTRYGTIYVEGRSFTVTQTGR